MSAENAWRIAMEAAAAVECDPEYADDPFLSLPMPSAFRAEVEAETEEVVRVLRGLVGRYEEIVMHEELGRSLDDHDLARARALLSRLEAKGESHE